MYSARNLLEKNPIQLSGVVVAFVNLLMILDWIDLAADAVAALNIFMVAFLGLFVTTKTTNRAGLQEIEEATGGEGPL
jgi:hypothetical protein